jgi:hypothetical protein
MLRQRGVSFLGDEPDAIQARECLVWLGGRQGGAKGTAAPAAVYLSSIVVLTVGQVDGNYGCALSNYFKKCLKY